MTIGGAIKAIALLAGILCAYWQANKTGFPRQRLPLFFCISLPAGWLGARIFYIIGRYGLFVDDPSRIFRIAEGGFALYGAVLAVLLTAKLYQKDSYEFRRLLDVLAPGTALSIAVGRLSDWAAEESFGPLVTNKSEQFFPLAQFIKAEEDWFYALFFFEMLLCLVLFFLLLAQKPRAGGKAVFFLIFYGMGRAVLESLREDALRIWFVRLSQVTAALCIIVIFVLALKRLVRERGFRRSDWVRIGSFVLLTAVGFWAEFYMGSESRARNMLLLTAALAGIAGIAYATYSSFARLQPDYRRPDKQFYTSRIRGL